MKYVCVKSFLSRAGDKGESIGEPGRTGARGPSGQNGLPGVNFFIFTWCI